MAAALLPAVDHLSNNKAGPRPAHPRERRSCPRNLGNQLCLAALSPIVIYETDVIPFFCMFLIKCDVSMLQRIKTSTHEIGAPGSAPVLARLHLAQLALPQ